MTTTTPRFAALTAIAFVTGYGLILASPASAQDADQASGGATTAPLNDGTLRVNQVVVYGDDPCPPSVGEDIVVCGRLAEDDRYRIPVELRGNPNDPQRESWTSRVQSLERVGRFGTDSCSPVGAGGFTGCSLDLINNAYAERAQAQGTDWTDAVATARRERVEGFDAEAEEIEAQVTLDEAARVAREQAAASSASSETETDPDPAPLPSPLAAPPRG